MSSENRNTYNVNYNELNNVADLPYNIIYKLINENESLWKLLKYNENNALSMEDLTQQQKRDLIYNGGQSEDGCKVYTNILFPDDSFNEQQSQLRIAINEISPNNNIYSNVLVTFQILTHTSITTLDNYQSRSLRIVNEIVKTLNGKEIGGIGKITLNKKNNIKDGIKLSKFNKNFNGYIIMMSLNST